MRSSSAPESVRSAARVLFEVAAALGARDGDDVVSLREHPGERELGRAHAALGGDLLHAIDDAQVLGEVLA